MKIMYEIIEGEENIDTYMTFQCQIVNVEIRPDNSPGGEDEMVFKLKVLPRRNGD